MFAMTVNMRKDREYCHGCGLMEPVKMVCFWVGPPGEQRKTHLCPDCVKRLIESLTETIEDGADRKRDIYWERMRAEERAQAVPSYATRHS